MQYHRGSINQNNITLAIAWCIQANRLDIFYTSTAWLHLRAEVLREFKGECQRCKARGFYRRACHVHHVKHVRDHPALALSKYYTDENGVEQRQLIPLCEACHAELHHEEKVRPKRFTTEERWD